MKKTVTIGDDVMPFSAACKLFNIPYAVAYMRLFKMGWSVVKTFETPVKAHKKTKPLEEAAKNETQDMFSEVL